MGPSEAISSLSQLQMHWAHAIALIAPVPNALGPNETIGTMSLYYNSGPIWASLSLSVKLHMVIINYYDKLLIHYVS